MGVYCRKTGKQHGMSGTPEWRAWRDMLSRCRCPSNKHFKDYGERGINVFPEWENSFASFFKELGPRPTPQHSLDRKNNDKGYEPGNCRWATTKQQARNKRSCNITDADADEIRRLLGERALLQKEIAERFGIGRPMVSLIKSGRYWA